MSRYVRLMPVILIPLLLLTACQSGADPEYDMLTSTNFRAYYTEADQTAAQEILDLLETNHDRITTDLRPDKSGQYTVRIYPNLQEFHKDLNMPNAPDWAVGTAWGDSELRIVSPNNPGPSHTYDSMLQVAVHEFAHCVTLRLAAGRDPRKMIWLWESIALYEAGQDRDLSNVPYMQTGQYPRFLEITDQTQSTEIYQLGYSIADYIVTTWGWEGIRNLVLNTGDVTKALNVSEDEFYAGWYAFAKPN